MLILKRAEGYEIILNTPDEPWPVLSVPMCRMLRWLEFSTLFEGLQEVADGGQLLVAEAGEGVRLPRGLRRVQRLDLALDLLLVELDHDPPAVGSVVLAQGGPAALGP